MAANKFRILLSVVAVALMLGTCFVPVFCARDDSSAGAASIAANADQVADGEDSSSVDDVLSYLSNLDMEELITSLGLPDMDIPHELFPNMTMEELFENIKLIMSGEKTLREVLEEAGVSYTDQIAKYIRSIISSIMENAGEILTDILISFSGYQGEPESRTVNSTEYIDSGEEYALSNGSTYTFGSAGKLIFRSGSKLVTDGNFTIISDAKDKTGYQIVLEAGCMVCICGNHSDSSAHECGHVHTVIADTSIELSGIIKCEFDASYEMGPVNVDVELGFGLDDGDNCNGYVRFDRKKTSFQLDSCSNDKDEFSFKIHADLTKTMLIALNEGDSSAMMADLANMSNKIDIEIEVLDKIGITDMVADIGLKVDYDGQGETMEKKALGITLSAALIEGGSQLAEGKITADFTQGEIMEEVSAFQEKTSKLIPFTGSITLDVDVGSYMLYQEIGLKKFNIDVIADYSVTVTGSDSFVLSIDMKHAAVEVGAATFDLQKKTVDADIFDLKVESEDLIISLPFDFSNLEFDKDFTIVTAGSKANGTLKIGNDLSQEITWQYEKLQNRDYWMMFDGDVIIPSKEIEETLILNPDFDDPIFELEIDEVVFEKHDGVESMSGSLDARVLMEFYSINWISDDESEKVYYTIDIDMTMDLTHADADGYLKLDGMFNALNDVEGTGVLGTTDAMALQLKLDADGYEVIFGDNGDYTVDGDFEYLLDFYSMGASEEKNNLMRFEMSYSSEEKQTKNLITGMKSGKYTEYDGEFFLGETVYHTYEGSYVGKDVSSVDSYYLDRQFVITSDGKGWIEASIMNGDGPLTIVNDGGNKTVNGNADIALIYGDSEVDDISIGRLNFHVGLFGTYEDDILDAIQRMGVTISKLKIQDKVDDDTYISISVPDSLSVEIEDATTLPIYTVSGDANAHISLNKIKIDVELDIIDDIVSRTVEVDKIKLHDVTGHAVLKTDLDITSGNIDDSDYYHIVIDGLMADVTLNGRLYTNSYIEVLGLLAGGSLITIDSFIYNTVTTENTNLQVDGLYLKYLNEREGYLTLELGRSGNSNASNRLNLSTSNFKISGNKVESLEFDIDNLFGRLYITPKDLSDMYVSGNFALNGFSEDTNIQLGNMYLNMSLGKGDSTEINVKGIAVEYETDSEIAVTADGTLVSEDFSISYTGSNGETTNLRTSKVNLGTAVDGIIVPSEDGSISFKEFNILVGSGSIADNGYDSDAGLTVDMYVGNSGDKFDLTASGMKADVTFTGSVGDISKIIKWNIDGKMMAESFMLDLKINSNTMTFEISGLETTLKNDPVRLKAEMTYSVSSCSLESIVYDGKYNTGKMQVAIECTDTKGTAEMSDMDTERVSVYVESASGSMNISNYADIFVKDIKIQMYNTFEEFHFISGELIFNDVIAVYPLYVEKGASIEFTGTNSITEIHIADPETITGEFQMGGMDLPAYFDEYVLQSGDDVDLTIGADYKVIVKSLQPKDIEVTPFKGHTITACTSGLAYTVSDEGNAVLSQYKGAVAVNNVVNNYTLTYEEDGRTVTKSVPYEGVRDIYKPEETKEGYTFAGWFDGTSYYDAAEVLSYVMPARDVNLEIVWSKNITFNEDCSDYSSVTFNANSFSQKLKDNSELVTLTFNGVTVSMDKTFLSELSDETNVTINASIISDMEDDVKERVGNGVCVNISVSDGESVSDFSGKFYITVEIPADWDSRTVKAFCIDSVIFKSADVVDVFTEGGHQYAKLSLTHFSQYMVDNSGTYVEEETPESNGGNGGTSGSSSDNTMMFIGIGIGAAVILLGAVIFFVKKH